MLCDIIFVFFGIMFPSLFVFLFAVLDGCIFLMCIFACVILYFLNYGSCCYRVVDGWVCVLFHCVVVMWWFVIFSCSNFACLFGQLFYLCYDACLCVCMYCTFGT